MAGQQGTLLNILTFSEMTDLVQKQFVYTQRNFQRNARSLFIEVPIGAGNGSTKRFDEIDTETYADFKAEGAAHKRAKIGVGYNKTMEARTFSKMIEITLEMRNDNRYPEVGQMITDLTSFCDNRQELDLTHRLTFATSTSYTDRNGETVATTTGDGLALLSAVHTLAFSSSTYSNYVSGAPVFSQGSFESAMLLAASNIQNNFNERRSKNFNTIVSWSDPSTVREIKQLINSMADVDAAQAGITNVYKGVMNHVVLDELATTAAGAYDSTKRRWWFVVAAGQGPAGWQAYLGTWIAPTLVTPSAGNNGEDIYTLNWIYATYCRYGIVTVSPQGIIGSPVSS